MSLRATTMSPKRKGSTGWRWPCSQKLKRSHLRRRLGHIQPQGIVLAGCDARRASSLRQGAAGARIDRAVRSMLGFAGARDLGGDFRAGAEAGIDQAVRLQVHQRLGIGAHAGGLAQGRLVPGKPQPFQVIENRLDELVAAAALVDVLDPQQEIVTALMGGDGGIGMAQMQKAGWTGCEPCDNHTLSRSRGNGRAPGNLTHRQLRWHFPVRPWPAHYRTCPRPATHLVVLVHGYGADGQDLIGLAQHWQGLLAHGRLRRAQRAGAHSRRARLSMVSHFPHRSA